MIRGGKAMELAQLLDTEVMVDFFKDVVTVGFLPGFMLATVLEFLGYAIFKAMSFLNIRL